MTQSVVVATNGTAQALAAIQQAGALALERDAIVHVVALDDDAPQTAEQVLEEAAAELTAMGVFVQRHVRSGRLADALAAVVRECDAGALVLPMLLALEVPRDE